MKKIVSTFILTLLGCGFALAQEFVVSGTVLDSLTREGEPAAVLQFFKSSDLDKPVAFTTTGTDGTFTQTLTGSPTTAGATMCSLVSSRPCPGISASAPTAS